MVRVALTIVWVALTLAYPLIVYVGLQRWPPHVLSGTLLGLLATLTTLRWLLTRSTDSQADDTPQGRRLPVWPLLTMGLLALGAILKQGMFVKAVPVMVSGGLLTMFALSLRSEQSMVERFARRQDPELTPDKVRYCRRVTIVWCWFFVFNITTTLVLAAVAPLSWWSLYTGMVAYVLIGTLFTVEYVVRKAKFRDYGRWWHDRALAAVFPPRDNEPKPE